MQAIYTRTMRVTDDGLGIAMEICQGLAKVRKKFFPKQFVPYEIGYISNNKNKINLTNSLKW